MARAKVGTGSLTPFKASKPGSETISNPTDGARRAGFFDKYVEHTASRNVTELTPFKTGPTGPGANTNPDHPPFRTGGNGIPKMPPPFKE